MSDPSQDPEQWIKVHENFLRCVLGRVTDSQELYRRGLQVDDLLQEVYLRLFKDEARLLHSYDPDRSRFSTWLTIVARSTAISLLRRKQLNTVTLERAPEVNAPAPEAQVEVPPFPADLLTARQSLVLQLLYEKDLSVDETATVLGVKAQTVRSAKHKALERLRAFFRGEKAGGDDSGDESV